MAFVHGKSGKVMVNAAHLSADIRAWNVKFERDLADVTALQDSGMRGLPGLHEGNVELEGFFDSTAGRLIQVVTDAANAGAAKIDGVDNGLLVTILPEGDTIGLPAIFTAADLENFEVEAEVDDAVKVTIEGTADNMVDMGTSHKALAAETASTNSASVDNLAGTTNGGAAILHVTTVSGTTPSLTVDVQHSTDNSTFVDLITFTAKTAAGYERKELAAGTTVNRYTRCQSTISGTSPSFTYQMSFARR